MDPTLKISEVLATTDWVVFAVVLLSTFGVVVWGNARNRKQTDGEPGILDLLLMGRRLTLPLFTATLVATWYGGILPVTGYAFDYGLYSWVTQGGFWYGAYLVFAFVLVGRIRATEATTMPDLLERQFGPKSGKLGAWMNLLNVLPVSYVLQLGIVLQLVFGGSLWQWMLTGVALVLLYSTRGGLRSVVLSDMLQFGVMCSAVALVFFFSLSTFGGFGWLKAQASIPAEHWKPFSNGVPLGTTMVWGLVAFGTLVDPNFYQRCLAAKSPQVAKRGILLATLVWVLFDCCTTFGAFYARANMPEADSSTAYLLYGVQLLPAGLKGFFLAGILATILSTLDSYLFLSGTVVAYDLAPKKWKGNVNVHHAGMVVMGLVAAVLTALFQEGNLVDIWKFFGGFISACLLLPLVLGLLLPGRLTDSDFYLAGMGGAGLILSFKFFQVAAMKLGVTEVAILHWEPFYIGVIGTLPAMTRGLFRKDR